MWDAQLSTQVTSGAAVDKTGRAGVLWGNLVYAEVEEVCTSREEKNRRSHAAALEKIFTSSELAVPAWSTQRRQLFKLDPESRA